jgi:hypothetical protein
LLLVAGFVKRALSIRLAAAFNASDLRVAFVTWWTPADWPVVGDRALSSNTTVAGVSALPVDASKVIRAFQVTLAAFFNHWFN